jgi:hypothetical protein
MSITLFDPVQFFNLLAIVLKLNILTLVEWWNINAQNIILNIV